MVKVTVNDIVNKKKFRIYLDTKLSGNYKEYEVGTEISDLRNEKFEKPVPYLQDNLSSFELSSGVCIEMFEHINFEGKSRKYCNNSEINGSVSYGYGQFENDQFSSFKSSTIQTTANQLSDKTTNFWQNDNKTGNIFSKTENWYINLESLAGTSVGNDNLSSFEIPPRTCLTIFEHANFVGWDFKYCNFNMNERMFVPLVNGFKENDNASSFKIEPLV